jgi:hypothetical protein
MTVPFWENHIDYILGGRNSLLPANQPVEFVLGESDIAMATERILPGEVAKIDISEPVEYFFTTIEDKQWHPRDDFFCSVSPFTSAWYESVAPKRSNYEGTMEPGPGTTGVTRFGWLIESFPIKKEHRSEMPLINPLMELMTATFARSGVEIQRGVVLGDQGMVDIKPLAFEESLSFDGHTPGFVQSTVIFFLGREKPAALCAVFDYLCEEGRVIDGTRVVIPLNSLMRESLESLDRTKRLTGIAACAKLMSVLQFSLEFLHCKNVEMQTVDPGKEMPRLQRKRRKQGRPPMVQHKILKIDGMRQMISKVASGNKTGIKMSLHTVRGQFRTYTADRPLFGRHAGRFFVPAHARGSRDVGQVKKDYAVTKVKKETGQ